MSSDFGIFILSHGRGESMTTDHALRKAGYTGRLFYVLDNTEKQVQAYRKRCKQAGDEILIFDKEKIAQGTDFGDNSGNRAAVIFARNAVAQLARQVGCKAYAMVDDDLSGFSYRVTTSARDTAKERPLRNFDRYCEIMVRFLKESRFAYVGMSHGGDWIGGVKNSRAIRRFWREGASNVFFCLADRAINWKGGPNEDMTTALVENCRGNMAISVLPIMCKEKVFSGASGGMTTLYERMGRYAQLFVPILYRPTAIRLKIGPGAIHQQVIRERLCPKILRAE